MIQLKGMTWSHPRGYDPMVACSALWRKGTGVDVVWDKRSLQDFESFPVEELARAYDLIVIDHPHVGQITHEGCLEPLDIAGRESKRYALAMASVGGSYPSYTWHGRQWAFPIDAAAQVQAYLPDRLNGPVVKWSDVIALARKGQVLIPLRPPHSLMAFYTLAGNLGTPCTVSGPGDLIDEAHGARVLDMMREIGALVDPACFDMDPIAVSECMAQPASPVVCAPLIYGYVSYAMEGFRPRRLAFADIPAAGSAGPVGSALGGTGIAVSAFSKAKEAAIDFAYWIAGAGVQCGLYPASGGQPGHDAGWTDEAANTAAGNFYRDTRTTLEGSWIRPRHNGYMTFQQKASDRLNTGLRPGEADRSVVADLNRLFRSSFNS